MDQRQIQNALNRYLQNLNRRVKVSSALVFGSLAEGKADPNDIDLLILSEDFKKLDTDERLKILYRASVGFPYDLHLFGLTPEELEKSSPLTTLGAIKQGKTLRLA